MKNSTITKCYQAMRLSIVDGKTKTEACEEVGININTLNHFTKTEQGQEMEKSLQEISRQLFLEQVRSDLRIRSNDPDYLKEEIV